MAGRILVLDDEENYAEMLQELLRGHNYQVDMATRPERAIGQLEEIPYDLVISDYKMPVMDGADFLKKARELYPNLPFILVSGLMNTPELVKVANMSVTLVMEKPLDTEAFLSHVAKFAKPMTDDEQGASTFEAADGGASDAAEWTYPEELRYFSAVSTVSKQFMQDLWSTSQEGSSLVILEPSGGDAALAVKDLSVWRGNSDQPVQTLSFEDFVTGGASKVKELLAHEEVSDVIAVRLSAPDQIAQAKEHLGQVLQLVRGADALFFVYVLEASLSIPEFASMTESTGCVLPALCERPADVAQYARRIARLVADRSAKPAAAMFSPEAVYAMLAYEWPRNYQQLQEVISAAVKQSEDAPLQVSALGDVLGAVDVPVPEERLSALMQRMQTRQLQNLIESGESVEALVQRLELGSHALSEDDLQQIPLVNPELATL